MHEALYWEVFRDTDTLKSLPWLIAKQNDKKGKVRGGKNNTATLQQRNRRQKKGRH